MNWQTHVPNIFGIGFNVTFIRFLHFFSVLILNMIILQPVVIRVIITKINDNRFYDTSIYTVFFAVFHFNFDHVFFCFCPHMNSLVSFNWKAVLFLGTKPLTCAHINFIGLSSQCRTGVLITSCHCKLAILSVL